MSTRWALGGPILAVDVLSTPNTFNVEVLMMQDTVDCMLTSPDPVNGVVVIMQDTVDCMHTDVTPDTVRRSDVQPGILFSALHGCDNLVQ